jgi:hypothetical protein
MKQALHAITIAHKEEELNSSKYAYQKEDYNSMSATGNSSIETCSGSGGDIWLCLPEARN